MPLNRLYSQPFYNMLISPLAEIKNQISNGDYQDAFFKAFNMKTKLEITDYHPFPAYQELLPRLQIRELVLGLCQKLIKLKNGEDVENSKAYAFAIISILGPFVHALNMLETTFKDPDQTKAKILYNTGKKLGLFGDTPTQAYDCNLNPQFIKRNDVQEQEIPATSAYLEIVGILNSFTDTRLRDLCHNLFSTINEIEKNDATLKSGEQNLFNLGYIERLITLSNEYKEQFRMLSDQLNQPHQNEEDENTGEAYNVLSSILNDKFQM